MDTWTRRRALAATAKVALGLTVGCAAEVTTDRGEPGASYPHDPDYEEGKEDGYASSALPYETELMCDAPPPPAEVALDAEQLRCCTEGIEPSLPVSSEDWEGWLAADDPDIAACCHVVTAQVDQDGGLLNEDVSWELFSACCSYTDDPVVACTPWGPPVPPAVRGGLPELRFERLAQEVA